MKTYMASPSTINREWYVASTTYHSLSIVDGLAIKLFMVFLLKISINHMCLY